MQHPTKMSPLNHLYCVAVAILLLMDSSSSFILSHNHAHHSLTKNHREITTYMRSLNSASKSKLFQLPIDISVPIEKNQQDLQDDQYHRSFINVARLYANENKTADDILQKLKQSSVLIIGIGGVGSWIAEALARSGIGNIMLLDLDDICISNINRQIHSTTSSIGKMKIEEMKRRVLDINPSCNVTLIHHFVTSDNAHETIEAIYNDNEITACIDAIDQKFEKASILASCYNLSIPVLTVGSSAGRTDPTLITVNDLTKCENDKLLFHTRKILRQDYSFPKGAAQHQKKIKIKSWNIMAVYSTQLISKDDRGESNEVTRSSFRRCDNGYHGTASFVTGSFGFAAASCVVDGIANDNLHPPLPFRPPKQ